MHVPHARRRRNRFTTGREGRRLATAGTDQAEQFYRAVLPEQFYPSSFTRAVLPEQFYPSSFTQRRDSASFQRIQLGLKARRGIQDAVDESGAIIQQDADEGTPDLG